MMEQAPDGAGVLFEPCTVAGLELPSRVAMAPMTRSRSAGGVPTDDVATYYARRAEQGVGLIVTEGAWVPHPGAADTAEVPRAYGDDALAGWATVADRVHAAGAKILMQLWHVGLVIKAKTPNVYFEDGTLRDVQVGPSGVIGGMRTPLEVKAPSMTQADIDAVVSAYAEAAVNAQSVGFDGIELHGGHGYLIDQFFWSETNRRTDRYGGDARARAQFGVDVVTEIKRRAGADFPVALRFSQWKLQDYKARLATTADELEQLLVPLAEAGVDLFDCSQRRFWEPEFEGSDLNLAGWAKRLTGRPTMTVGSVGLDADLGSSMGGTRGAPARVDRLVEMLEAGECDLAAVGRALVSDPSWASRMARGEFDQIRGFSVDDLAIFA
jgi:2,4-dienoyl-CoA reductase-like NADH-dependent reductase (Old Yellow Enzyme family)